MEGFCTDNEHSISYGLMGLFWLLCSQCTTAYKEREIREEDLVTIQAGDSNGLRCSGGSRDNDRWLKSGYILKADVTAFPTECLKIRQRWLQTEGERTHHQSHAFAPQSCVFFWGRRVEVVSCFKEDERNISKTALSLRNLLLKGTNITMIEY